VLSDELLCSKLVNEGLKLVESCCWPVVREQWLNTYQELVNNGAT